MTWTSRIASWRRRFVLTTAEKNTIWFVLGILVLGIGTRCYRENHKPAPPEAARAAAAAEAPARTPARAERPRRERRSPGR